MKPTTGKPQAQPQPVDPAVIPAAMRAAKRWLLHDSKKIPYYASGTRRAGKLNSPRDLARLVTFPEAVEALAKFTEIGMVGLGFALGEGWQGCDLDKVRDEEGILAPWAAELIEKSATYAEVSPSGKGVHLIFFDVDAEALTLGANGSGIEFYSTARYFTVTGRALNGAKLRAFKAVLDLMTRQHITQAEAARRAEAKPSSPIVPGVPSMEWDGFAHELRQGLPHIPAGRGRARWLAIGMGIHLVSGGNEAGYKIWRDWSRDYHGGDIGEDGKLVYNEAHCRRDWDSFKPDPDPKKRVNWGTVQHYLNEFAPKSAAPSSPHKLPTEFMLDELDEMDIAPTEWLVEGIIAPGLTLLTAPPKQGKSYLSLQMGMCVAAGVHFLGRATRSCRVTYFDLEEWHALLKERVAPIRAGNHIPKGTPLAICLESGVGEQALKDMAREIARGSKLVIVDLLARIRDEMSEDAKKNVYARDMKFIGALATFSLAHPGVAIVVVHHANKGTHDDWQNKISGSAGMAGASHCNIYLARPNLNGLNAEDREHAMRYRVLHANGKQVKEQELVLEMMDAGGGWQVSPLRSWEIQITRIATRVLEVLRAHYPEWVNSQLMADLLGVKRANVRQVMHRMARDGHIESGGRGGDGFRSRK